MIELKESQAQLLAWELKDEAWAEVAHLPLLEAFRERRRRSAETLRALGFENRVRDPRVRPVKAITKN
jgi:hypothetical protein